MSYWAPSTHAGSALPQHEFEASLSLPDGKRCMLERAAREVQQKASVVAAAKKKQEEMDKRFKKSPVKSPMKSPVKADSPFGSRQGTTSAPTSPRRKLMPGSPFA